MSADAQRGKIDLAYDVKKMNECLDWINVMAYALWTQSNTVKVISPYYDMWTRAKVTGHFTAMAWAGEKSYMKKYPKKTVQASIQHWIDKGMDKCKINLGTATYGKSFKLSDPEKQFGLGAPSKGEGDPGPILKKAGTRHYQELCKEEWDEDDKGVSKMVSYENSAVKAPYAAKGDLWVAYETPDSMKYKVREVVNKFDYKGDDSGLGGISFWTLGLDDLTNKCGTGHFPLIRAAVMEMGKDNGKCKKQ